MKFRQFLFTLLIFVLSYVPAFNILNINKDCQRTIKQITNYTLTYERVYIDYVWWIYIYQDGTLIGQYIDDDQD